MNDCSKCEAGTRVIQGSGIHYECAAIESMNIQPKKECHLPHHVQVNAVTGEIFIPHCCPNKEVSKEQRKGGY